MPGAGHGHGQAPGLKRGQGRRLFIQDKGAQDLGQERAQVQVLSRAQVRSVHLIHKPKVLLAGLQLQVLQRRVQGHRSPRRAPHREEAPHLQHRGGELRLQGAGDGQQAVEQAAQAPSPDTSTG